jgi:hypothetical protein
MKTKILSMLALGMLTYSCSNVENLDQASVSTDNDSTSLLSDRHYFNVLIAKVDRFSAVAGHLFVRNETNDLPASNKPIYFDREPFITKGLDRTGAIVKYYNFDVQPTSPDDIYVFFKEGSSTPVRGQINVIPTIPGDAGYNDFWVVNKVTVPNNYIPNSLRSESQILASGYKITKTTKIVNCPVVPFGSVANKSKISGVRTPLTIGWYKGKFVAYFQFDEAEITATASGMIPTDDIYVMFNIDPSPTNPASGPASGFKTVQGTTQTHNVLASLPGDSDYTPLWRVDVISNVNFDLVKNLMTAESLPSSPAGANVNCPVVK